MNRFHLIAVLAAVLAGCTTVAKISDLERQRNEPKLVSLLIEEAAWVRMHATRGLGRMGAKNAAEAIEKLLTDGDEREPVRREAAIALGRLKLKRSVPALTAAAIDPSTPAGVKLEVVVALCAIGAHRTFEPLTSDEDVLVSDMARTKLAKGCP